MIQVVGNINFDITAMLDKTRNIEENRVLELDPGIGGTASNTAIQLAKLEREVILNGALGNDIFGQWLLKELKKEVSTWNMLRLPMAREQDFVL